MDGVLDDDEELAAAPDGAVVGHDAEGELVADLGGKKTKRYMSGNGVIGRECIFCLHLIELEYRRYSTY